MIKRAILILKSDTVKCVQVTFHPEMESFFKQFEFHILKSEIIDNDAMKVNLE
jgi:hypothetical protein